MGISLAEAHVLFSLKRRGALGDEFLSLGRPEIYISKRELQGLVSAYDLSWSENDISRATSAAYAEPLLQLLGFRTVRSLDISAYQGANIIHDLNWPIPKEFEATTTFLYGNGTIEHVFDIATALKNVVRLLRVGGMVVIAGPANGYCGHGFYQFSPELFYNVLSLNGFDHVRVYIVGRSYPQRWFRAANPKELKRRVEFMTTEPTDIIVIACKEASFRFRVSTTERLQSAVMEHVAKRVGGSPFWVGKAATHIFQAIQAGVTHICGGPTVSYGSRNAGCSRSPAF